MTNRTIIPSSVFAKTTTAHTIVSGTPSEDLYIKGYGLGWFRMSYRGHDVNTSPFFYIHLRHYRLTK